MNNKMEAETMNANYLPSFLHRSLHAVAPMLMISMGYIDPGKWAATVEGGARFGFDLMAFMLVFNFAAILCQYISAKIGVITGKDLAEICRDEYGAWTCMFLGIQTELSVIILDLNVIMGMAHVLNLIFGWDLFTCVLLAATSAASHLLLAILLDNGKAKVMGLFVAGFVLLFAAFGVLINRPEIPVSTSGVLTKLSGESAFVLMSLLGATLVPHNFYLYSSVVQWHRGSINVSKDAMFHKHFLAIFCVFSGIYLVNNMMMSAAANEFNGTGLVLLTFQDALSPMEQVLQSPMALPAFLLFLFISNQTTALAWSLGGEVVVHSFLKLDIPGWLHYATIRVIAVLPALYCVWSAGAEGMYQLLVFTQVVVALQLPSSVIPLFRIATSKSIMGVHKISQFMEFLAWVVFIGILGLNIIFVVEMIFGNSNWVDYLRWNGGGSGMSASYSVLISTACVLFGLMLWLAITPLKSASAHLDAQAWNCDEAEAIEVPPIESQESDLTETRCHRDASLNVKEPSPTLAIDSETSELHVTTGEESYSITQLPTPPSYLAKESASPPNSEALSTVANEISDAGLAATKTEELKASAQFEKTVEVEAVTNAERDDDDGDSWEAEELSKVASAAAPSSTSEGPASFRSLSGKSDEGGIGSLSRLAGLGRAARRNLAAILDEFWGELYDYHGQAIEDAKAKKLDVLSGVDLRFSGYFKKVNASGNDCSEYVTSVGSRTSDSLMNSSLYDSPKFPRIQSSFEPSYSLQRSSSSFQANPTELLDAYGQNSNRKVLYSGERRYSSVRNLPSSEVWDSQPATVHGYQIASYLSRVGRDRIPDNLNGQGKLSSLKSPLTATNASYRDPIAFALGKKLQDGAGAGAGRPPGFENVTISRNSTLPSETSCYDFCFPGPADNVGSSVNTKKYHSLPDISGYAIPRRDVYASDKNAAFEGSVYGSAKTSYEPRYSNSGSRRGAPLAFDEVSPSKDYRDALSSQLGSDSDTGSLWSKQPFEQFGVAGKIHSVGMEGVGTRPSSISQETASVVAMEVKLQSFRHCILRLLKLEGSDWLFRQNGGVDEDLIDRVAASEKFLYEVETRETNSFNFSVTSVPHCGEGCIWRSDLIISFGVWCIHRILELSLMESRPELWGKYTYVLNRLQGVIDPAFSKPRKAMTPCFCLQIPASHQQKSSPTFSNGVLPPPPAAKAGRGKFTTAPMMLDLIKDVDIAISSRKGRTGTAAGDVAFPKGKENLASVLKRYKRRLSNKSFVTVEGNGSRRIISSAPYNNNS